MRVNEAVKCALNDPFYSFDLGFEVGIQYTSSSSTTQVKFMVHHRIDGQCMKTGLQEWATDQKLVPWVAVAAQFPVSLSIFLIGRVLGRYRTNNNRYHPNIIRKALCLQCCPCRFSTASRSIFMLSLVSRRIELGCINSMTAAPKIKPQRFGTTFYYNDLFLLRGPNFSQIVRLCTLNSPHLIFGLKY